MKRSDNDTGIIIGGIIFIVVIILLVVWTNHNHTQYQDAPDCTETGQC